MGNIDLYTGTLTYWKGTWVKDPSGNNFIDKDMENMECNIYDFTAIPAKSVEQLTYILSRKIQDEKELSYPVHIDWLEIKSNIIGSIPDSSDRFESLTTK